MFEPDHTISDAAVGAITELTGRFSEVAAQQTRPSVLYRPRLMADGNQWCALYGEDLQEGLAGFGDTPHAAMCAFDDAWYSQRLPMARAIPSQESEKV